MAKNLNFNEYLFSYIKKKPDIDDLKKELPNALKKYLPDFNVAAIKNLDYDRTLVEFENWLVGTVTNDPIPISTKTIHFSITDNATKEDNVPHVPEIQFCLTGSKYAPSDKPTEWHYNRIWEPTGKNSEIKAFKTLSNALKNYTGNPEEMQIILFGMVGATLIVNGFDIIKHEFLVNSSSILVTMGFNFDNGPKFLVGTLDEDDLRIEIK